MTNTATVIDFNRYRNKTPISLPTPPKVKKAMVISTTPDLYAASMVVGVVMTCLLFGFYALIFFPIRF